LDDSIKNVVDRNNVNIKEPAYVKLFVGDKIQLALYMKISPTGTSYIIYTVPKRTAEQLLIHNDKLNCEVYAKRNDCRP
jgi:hypothetical protein